MDSKYPWIIALTGASGTCYGRRLIAVLLEQLAQIELEVVVSEAAIRVMREEENLPPTVGKLTLDAILGRSATAGELQRVRLHSNRNIGASIASGSYRTGGMVIVPCSMRTLAAISNGLAENLIHRAADVILKEKRRLVMVPRETPLSAIHLENMLRLARLDVRMVPAMPGFYTKPASVDEIVDQMVARIVDQMDVGTNFGKRWPDSEVENANEKEVVGGV